MVDTKFLNQCERIVSKLQKAKTCDASNAAFGAATHRYNIGPPISLSTLNQFESTHSVVLPNAFKTFLNVIGNGNDTPHLTPKHMTYGCGAGPYYGLFPLGKYLSISENNVLSNVANVSPNMKPDKWDNLLQGFDEPNISDEEYERILGSIYSGILPIGHQGCTGWQALVLTGEYAGRVIYLDEELSGPPKFTQYDNFLDWYESWLDGVISGPDQKNAFEGAIYLSRT